MELGNLETWMELGVCDKQKIRPHYSKETENNTGQIIFKFADIQSIKSLKKQNV